MKKFLSIISLFFLSGCSVAKPVILNASLKKPIQKAFTSTNVTNSVVDVEPIIYARTSLNPLDNEIVIDGENYFISFYAYATPIINPLKFNYRVLRSYPNANYYVYECSIPFQYKIGLEIARESDGAFHNVVEIEQTMPFVNDVENLYNFRSYHIPTVDNMLTTSEYQIFLMNNTISLHMGGNGAIYVEPETMEIQNFTAYARNGALYFRNNYGRNNIAVENPRSYWIEPYIFVDWREYIASESVSNALAGYFARLLGINSSYTKKYYSFYYDTAMSEELQAFSDGYDAGIDEGTAGVGTSWVQQVFRAIQGFLNFDFGFFKLGHVIGGMLVIGFVIFILRQFR